ncbi:MAG: transcription repressor NadR [Oscillospiraceae bacterium]
MTAEQRRSRISARLHESHQPISATALARELGVSRQIIVGDVALLRAAGQAITATARGYVIPDAGRRAYRARWPAATTAPAPGTKLNAMVDCGCTVVDVIVDHPVYGQLSAPLHLRSRLDVEQFMARMEGAAPLSQLTDGIHLHSLSCPDEASYEHLKARLRELGFLAE